MVEPEAPHCCQYLADREVGFPKKKVLKLYQQPNDNGTTWRNPKIEMRNMVSPVSWGEAR